MKRFLARTVAQTASILVAVSLAFGVIFAALAGFGALAGSGAAVRVAPGSVLIVDLDARLSEVGPRFTLPSLFEGDLEYPLAVHEAAAALHRAAKDERVAAVLLTGGIRGSAASLAHLREALGAIREAGKPVLAYYTELDERGLWFASAADEIWLEPLGLVEFDGFAVTIPYLGEALERYGIGVQLIRVGEYKSAGEAMSRGDMSPEEREQLTQILVGLETPLFEAIAEARGLTRDALAELVRERGLLDARDAAGSGLVDRVAPFHDLLGRMRERLDLSEDAALAEIDLRSYALARPPRALRRSERGPGVMVIPAAGEIVDGSSELGIGGDDLARLLRSARHDDDVRAVVLRVDSPGGSPSASEVIRQEVLALRAAGKPVVASMGAVAASGGYWISASADRILAQPETITGSIGVFGMLVDVERLTERHGVRAERVETGPLAGAFTPWRRADERQVAVLQNLVDRIYGDFLDLVAEGRSLEPEAVEAAARGRVWVGAEALELGLVDELGDMDRAVQVARELAALGEEAPVRFWRPERTWLDNLLLASPGDEDPRLARGFGLATQGGLRAELAGALDHLERLERLAGSARVLARLPFDWDF